MIVIDEKFLVIKEINGYLVDMLLINSFRSGLQKYLRIIITIFRHQIIVQVGKKCRFLYEVPLRMVIVKPEPASLAPLQPKIPT
jgi:hypothetical protein